MADIGLIGLGTMGTALALNIAENGYQVAVSNRTTSKIDEMIASAGPLTSRLTGCNTLPALVEALASPRSVILMVPAGKPVDAMIEALAPLLSAGDTIIDAGNADFNDTRRREEALSERRLNFIGMGVSGGEEGARHGPSIMVGGPELSFGAIRDVVEAIAADFEGTPCAAWLGPDGAGHFVKTVHNGIEYADMQLIAETYGLMRDGQGKTPDQIAPVFEAWNTGPLRSYLIEITATVLVTTDPETGAPLVESIRDSAGQKGTGRWTVIEALKLGQSASAIEAAVGARAWSAMGTQRSAGEDRFGAASGQVGLSEDELEQALLAARIIAYGQGLSLLTAASDFFDWSLDLARIAEIWRAGCIIRSDLLDDIAAAARTGLPEDLLILAPDFASRMEKSVPVLRKAVLAGVSAGLPMPAMSAALSWFDAMRQSRGTADLIQGQRDYFGRHGFARLDGRTDQHGPWAD